MMAVNVKSRFLISVNAIKKLIEAEGTKIISSFPNNSCCTLSSMQREKI
jgi:hypothetical protein